MIHGIYLASIMILLVRLFIGLMFGCFLVYFALHCIDGVVLKRYAVLTCICGMLFLAFPGKREIVTYLVLTKIDSYLLQHDADLMNPDVLVNVSTAMEKVISETEKTSERMLGGKK